MFLKSRSTMVASAVLASVVLGSAVHAAFTDDFSTYSSKADIEAFYGIEYTGGATAASWSFDAANNKIDFNLAAGQGVYFYVLGTMSTNDGIIGTEISADTHATNQGQFNYLGSKITNEDNSFVAWTAVWAGSQARADSWHTGLSFTGVLSVSPSQVGFVLQGSNWSHVTNFVDPFFWNINPENPFTFDNVATNRIGFFAEAAPFPDSALTGSIIGFHVDGTVTSPVPEPTTLGLLAAAGLLMLRRR